MNRANRRGAFKTSDLTPEEVLQFMDGTASDSEDDDLIYSDEDNDSDADYDPHLDEISPEDDIAIDRHLEAASDTMSLANAINISLNLSLPNQSPFVTPSASSTLNPILSLSHEEEVETEPQPSTSNAVDVRPAVVRPAKRLRSPLPLMETTGPTILNEVAFQGNCRLPSAIQELVTPMQFFCYFFDNDIVQMIAAETNRHAVVENVNTNFSIADVDVYKYIGILMYMSVYKYPNLESYWSENAFIPIANTMAMKRFMAIKKHLSLANQAERKRKGEPGYDPIFRIRSLANKLNARFDSIPKTARLCVDEQMCSTKMRHHLRQYMPNKPHKWGIKLFVLCDSSGYAYRFEVYNGAGDNVVLLGCPDLGSTSNVVVRLSQTVDDFKHHIIYFDNFYTSIPLLVYLRGRGIYSLGTVRANRIPNCKLPTDKEVNKMDRGYSTEFVGRAYGVDIATVLWKDNKCVRLASTYVGELAFARANPENQPAKASRFDRKAKKYVSIDCPQIIREYNSHMGGVDLMDGLMGRYHIRAKSRDAMVRLFYHFIDMAATNSYILYRRLHAEKYNEMCQDSSLEVPPPKPKLFDLPEFR